MLHAFKRHSRSCRAIALTVAASLGLFSWACLRDLRTRGQDQTPVASKPVSRDFEIMRQQMVERQLAARDIRDDRVLAAMARVPRHLFVPESLMEAAYDDNALPIGLGQTISQPYIVAYMTQTLELKGGEKVLEVGTGSGYQAAILAELVPEVYTIEILQELSDSAASLLARVGYTNIHFRVGDGYQGWPEAAPFDCVIVTAAPSHVPQPLIDQLKVGGRMIIPVGVGEQDLLLIRKEESGVTRRLTIPVRFVPMTGRAQKPPPQ